MSSETQIRMLRFAVVGAGVAAFYVILYLALLKLGFYQPLANIVAFISAVAVQYVAQTIWTFQRYLGVPKQILRFICTVGLGLLVSALITGILGPAMGWPSWVSAVLVTLVLPVQNYIFFRIWVFPEADISSES